MSQIQNAEERNVKLRKEIRLFETELYLMYQRNAHDSAVIDGLQVWTLKFESNVFEILCTKVIKID